MNILPPGLTLISSLLSDLNLRGNNIADFPETAPWVALRTLGLAGNGIRDVPRNLMNRGVKIDFSGNPVEVKDITPTEVEVAQKRSLILDGTDYCTAAHHAASSGCNELCGPQCFTYMVGDYFCDLACFTAACNYDDGDCDVYGFERL
jgi:hypothetical protein